MTPTGQCRPRTCAPRSGRAGSRKNHHVLQVQANPDLSPGLVGMMGRRMAHDPGSIIQHKGVEMVGATKCTGLDTGRDVARGS